MKYCEHIAHTISFDLNYIVPCCTCFNGEALKYHDVFVDDEKKLYNLNFETTQDEMLQKLNCEELKNYSCSNCIFLKEVKELPQKDNLINNIFLRFWTECNCNCVYCDNTREKITGFPAKYNPYPLIKKLYETNKIDTKNLFVRVQGGDLSVLPDFEDYLALFEKYGYHQIHFSTNNIIYQPKIEKVLKECKGSLNVSLDCGTKETYLKIKQVDCFNQVVKNLSTYLSKIDNPKAINVHYIIVKGYNDNKKEIDEFLNLMKKIGVSGVGIRIDHKDLDSYLKNKTSESSITHYHALIEYFYQKAQTFNFRIDSEVCIEQNFLLKKSSKKSSKNILFEKFFKYFKMKQKRIK